MEEERVSIFPLREVSRPSTSSPINMLVAEMSARRAGAFTAFLSSLNQGWHEDAIISGEYREDRATAFSEAMVVAGADGGAGPGAAARASASEANSIRR